MNDLVKPVTEVRALVERAAYYGKSTIADATKKAYLAEFEHFRKWAEARGLPHSPPDVPTVAVYLAALADGNVEITWTARAGKIHTTRKLLKYGSIQHNYQAIIFVTRAAGHEWAYAHDAIRKVMHGIRYRKGSTKKRMAPLEIADLKACLAKMRERRFEDLDDHPGPRDLVARVLLRVPARGDCEAPR